MYGSKRVAVRDLNPHILCALCGGYLIQATTVIECLHSFCRSCIVNFLETSKVCPICDVQVHKTRPLLNIRPDQTLQSLVYKLVPGLFQDEMRRRREFHATLSESDVEDLSLEERGEAKMEKDIKAEDDHISLVLQMTARKDSNTEFQILDRRYLLCPCEVTVRLLKKFIRMKFQLSAHHEIQMYRAREELSDDLMLQDVALIYSWCGTQPLHICYTVIESPKKTPAKWIGTEVVVTPKKNSTFSISNSAPLPESQITDTLQTSSTTNTSSVDSKFAIKTEPVPPVLTAYNTKSIVSEAATVSPEKKSAPAIKETSVANAEKTKSVITTAAACDAVHRKNTSPIISAASAFRTVKNTSSLNIMVSGYSSTIISAPSVTMSQASKTTKCGSLKNQYKGKAMSQSTCSVNSFLPNTDSKFSMAPLMPPFNTAITANSLLCNNEKGAKVYESKSLKEERKSSHVKKFASRDKYPKLAPSVVTAAVPITSLITSQSRELDKQTVKTSSVQSDAKVTKPGEASRLSTSPGQHVCSALVSLVPSSSVTVCSNAKVSTQQSVPSKSSPSTPLSQSSKKKNSTEAKGVNNNYLISPAKYINATGKISSSSPQMSNLFKVSGSQKFDLKTTNILTLTPARALKNTLKAPESRDLTDPKTLESSPIQAKSTNFTSLYSSEASLQTPIKAIPTNNFKCPKLGHSSSSSPSVNKEDTSKQIIHSVQSILSKKHQKRDSPTLAWQPITESNNNSFNQSPTNFQQPQCHENGPRLKPVQNPTAAASLLSNQLSLPSSANSQKLDRSTKDQNKGSEEVFTIEDSKFYRHRHAYKRSLSCDGNPESQCDRAKDNVAAMEKRNWKKRKLSILDIESHLTSPSFDSNKIAKGSDSNRPTSSEAIKGGNNHLSQSSVPLESPASMSSSGIVKPRSSQNVTPVLELFNKEALTLCSSPPNKSQLYRRAFPQQSFSSSEIRLESVVGSSNTNKYDQYIEIFVKRKGGIPTSIPQTHELSVKTGPNLHKLGVDSMKSKVDILRPKDEEIYALSRIDPKQSRSTGSASSLSNDRKRTSSISSISNDRRRSGSGNLEPTSGRGGVEEISVEISSSPSSVSSSVTSPATDVTSPGTEDRADASTYSELHSPCEAVSYHSTGKTTALDLTSRRLQVMKK